MDFELKLFETFIEFEFSIDDLHNNFTIDKLEFMYEFGIMMGRGIVEKFDSGLISSDIEDKILFDLRTLKMNMIVVKASINLKRNKIESICLN